ncbi:MAG: hypothetical protein ACOY94_28530 [Bacillota bacterium]
MIERAIQTEANPRRRGFSVGRAILLLVVVILLAGLFLIGRTGLVPGLSQLLGAAEPRDLGVRPTSQEFTAVLERVGYTLDNKPEAANMSGYRKVYQGKKQVDQDLTESELSALLTYNHVTWWPLSNVQLKVHEDGTMEASLSLITRNIPWEMAPESLLRQLPDRLPEQVPIYLKGRLDVVGPTQFATEIERLEIGRVAVPDSVLTTENKRLLTNLVNDRARGIPGFSVERIDYQEGKLHFKGTFPESFRRVPVNP